VIRALFTISLVVFLLTVSPAFAEPCGERAVMVEVPKSTAAKQGAIVDLVWTFKIDQDRRQLLSAKPKTSRIVLANDVKVCAVRVGRKRSDHIQVTLGLSAAVAPKVMLGQKEGGLSVESSRASETLSSTKEP